MESKIEKIQKLITLLNLKNIETNSNIEKFFNTLISYIKDSQGGLEKLTLENIDKIQEVVSSLKDEISTISETTTKQLSQEQAILNEQIIKVQQLIEQVKNIKPIKGKDGIDGKNVDENAVVASVLSKIPLPEYTPTVLDEGEQIVEKINSLPIDDDFLKIDATHIKNLPEFIEKSPIPNGGGWRNLFQLHDVSAPSPTNGQALVYNSTTKLWEATTISSGGVTSLNSLTGALSITSGGAGVTINPSGSNIAITPQHFLNEIASLSSAVSPGFLYLDQADDAIYSRQINGSAAISVSNPETGNVTIDANGFLKAISIASGFGFLVNDGSGNAVYRSLIAGSGISITNDHGVAGSPTISSTGVSSIGVSAPITSTGGTTPTIGLDLSYNYNFTGQVVVSGTGLIVTGSSPFLFAPDDSTTQFFDIQNDNNTGAPSTMRFFSDNYTNYTSFKAPIGMAADANFIWPSSILTSVFDVPTFWVDDGAGNLSELDLFARNNTWYDQNIWTAKSNSFTGSNAVIIVEPSAATGTVNIRANTGTNAPTPILFFDTANAKSVSIIAPTTLSSSWVLKLPVSAGSLGQVLRTDGLGASSWVTPTSGTVTSVAQSFTGGLISVAGSPITTSGTLALTVAGTSGGVPYFSSTSTWASSALLAANALMIGGGAGAAPSTVTTGTGVLTALAVNVGSAGAFVTFNGAGGTPSSLTGTNISGTAASLTAGAATVLATSRNLWGQAFTGAADVTGSLTSVGDITGGASSMIIQAGTGASRTLTLKTTTSGSAAQTNLTLNADQSSTFSGLVALGANSLTMTGSLAATGARVTKGWFTDIESTNMPTVGGTAILTSLTAPQFTTIELGAASDTTLSRVSAGVIAVEGSTVALASNNLSFFSATTSAQLAGVISDETGTGALVFGTSPTIVTPTIASFTNATHNHQNAAGGGTLDLTLIGGSTILPVANGGTGIAVIGPRIFAYSRTTVNSTNTTAEEALASILIPANTLGNNDEIEIWALFSGSGAGTKTARARLHTASGTGGTIYYTIQGGTLASGQIYQRIVMKNANNSQESVGSGTIIGASSSAVITSSLSTTAAIYINLTSQKATGTDNLSLNNYTITIKRI